MQTAEATSKSKVKEVKASAKYTKTRLIMQQI